MTDRIKRKALFLAMFLVSAVMLVGCNEGNATSPGSDNAPVVTFTGKRAEMLTKLDSRFVNEDLHFELGQSYRKDGLWTQAEYHFETSLRFDPTHRDAQAAMTKLLIDSGQQTKADRCASRYIKQADYSLKETMKLGKAFQAERAEEYAFECYQQAVRLAPNSPQGHKALGRYYLNKNDEELAKQYFKQSFRLDPSQAEVAGELGRLGVIVRIPRDVEGAG